MNHASLFSGIGGFDLAAEWMGWTNVFNCEIDPFCQKVLKYHFPDALQFRDIKQLKFKRDERGQLWVVCNGITAYLNRLLFEMPGEIYNVGINRVPDIIIDITDYEKEIQIPLPPIDIISGGFPCQPFSMAGKRRGTDDDRHLWPEMLRTIREIAPRWVVGENVYGFVNWNGGMVFDQVLSDLENEGYEVQPFIIPACAVNAPHRRDRVWIVAHRNAEGWGERHRQKTNLQGREMAESGQERDGIRNDVRAGCQTVYGTPPHATGTGGRIGLRGEREWTAEIQGFGREQGIEFRTCCQDGDAADTDSGIRCEGWMHPDGRGQAERHTGTRHARADGPADWHHFPTQPPLRSRNDGFSGQLDGITVSKLRNESIKAAGNAIVPQVALQIFKAIQQYEDK